jgi:hypothetical protein
MFRWIAAALLFYSYEQGGDLQVMSLTSYRAALPASNELRNQPVALLRRDGVFVFVRLRLAAALARGERAVRDLVLRFGGDIDVSSAA